MAWSNPNYTRQQVDKAGRTLVTSSAGEELDDALGIINNWRSSHSFPLNTFQMTLRRKSEQIDETRLIAQRIKRLSSIEQKLKRFPTMNLSQMQDIGGCRAVLSSVRQVKRLHNLYLTSDLRHKLARVDDYIGNPKLSGYRGVHLIYRYYSDRTPTYQDLQIEMQFRSRLQHAWATAVETVGTFLQQALKASEGHERWLRFFALMGSAHALRERTPLVPGTPTTKTHLTRELRQAIRELEVRTKLEGYGLALQSVEKQRVKGAKYYLLHLEPSIGRLSVTGYEVAELERANADYLQVEKSLTPNTGAEAVLVAVESLESLRRAYPNYYLDTKAFIKSMRAAVEG